MKKFDVFKLQPGKYLNSPKQLVPAGEVEAETIESAAITAIYKFGNSQLAVKPHAERDDMPPQSFV